MCLSLWVVCGDASDMLLQVVTGFCRQTQVAPAGHRLLQPAWGLLHSAFAWYSLLLRGAGGVMFCKKTTNHNLIRPRGSPVAVGSGFAD